MNRISVVLILVFIFVSGAVAQFKQPEKKPAKAKKSKSFDPPREAPGGMPSAGGPIAGPDSPPPPAMKFPLEAWKEMTFAQEQFAVSFPTKPEEQVTTNSGNGVETKEYEVITMDGTYSVTAIKLPNRRKETKEELQQRLRGMLKQLESGPYQWLGGKEIEVDGYPGIEFRYKLTQFDKISWQRFIAVDDCMYRVIADTLVRDPELKEPPIFMGSFKLLPREKVEAESTIPPPPPPPAANQSFGGVPRPTTMRVSGGVLNDNAIKKVKANYPQEALAARATGAVQVAITVSEEGKVIEARAVSGHDLLREAAVSAAKQWTFKPMEISGVPVRVQGVLTLYFFILE